MTSWIVDCVTKASDDDITGLGVHQAGDLTKVRKSKAEAIKGIKAGDIYYSKSMSGPKVIVVEDPDGEYLRSSPDATPDNNLDNLPICH